MPNTDATIGYWDATKGFQRVDPSHPLPVSVGGAAAGVAPPVVPQNAQGGPSGSPTYQAILTGYAAYATPTDMFALRNPVGSGKTLGLWVAAMGIRATAATLLTLTTYRRASLNTGGTPTDITAAKLDSNNPAPVGVPRVYGAAPTIVDGAALPLSINIANDAVLTNAPAIFTTNGGGGFAYATLPAVSGTQPITIRPGEEFVFNFSGAALPAGFSAICAAQWFEF